MREKIQTVFKDKFGSIENAVYAFSPGRVNLIGEHTDYNGGHVFPCALTMGTYLMGRKRNDNLLRFYSLNRAEDGVISSSLDDMRPLNDEGWSSYVKGTVWAFKEKGIDIPFGVDVVIGGDIPAGAGLSSSASLEVAVGVLLRSLFDLKLSNRDISILGKKAENDYVGMNCGIMDQFASAMGKKDHAILLDTETLDYEYVPLKLEGKSIVITNTNKEHELASSAYNQRREECSRALGILKEEMKNRGRVINALGDLTVEEFEDVQRVLTEDVLKRRARHAVTENQRTLQAFEALKREDIVQFGRLMNESHASLRDDYEVSCRELDLLAETAQKMSGVYGSRMTGGGFGGCTVSIVDESAFECYCRRVTEVYKKNIGYDCTIYTATAGSGPYTFGLMRMLPLKKGYFI